ncbi:unnamed protein product, partial [Ectocarpus sp. 12 AP-2014]
CGCCQEHRRPISVPTVFFATGIKRGVNTTRSLSRSLSVCSILNVLLSCVRARASCVRGCGPWTEWSTTARERFPSISPRTEPHECGVERTGVTRQQLDSRRSHVEAT